MVFLACNLGLLIVAYLVLHPHLFHLVSFGSWVPAALFFTFIPISVALMQGQDSIILLLLITATYGAVRRDRQGVGGFLLGLGLFKFQIVVPIAILFLLWRRWRFVVGFLVSALAALAASVAVVGRDGLVTYFHYLLLISSQSNQFASAVYPSTMANLRGLFFALGISVPFLVIASLAVLAMAARMRPSLEVAIVTACLISYHLNVHDMSILIVPALTSLDQERAQGWLLILAPILILWPGWFCLAALMSLLFLVPELRSRPELATRVSTS
jgi:hypothetical protein